ncbi:hypothetical protein WA158_004109 [Blastocystis sp. Blastoise]
MNTIRKRGTQHPSSPNSQSELLEQTPIQETRRFSVKSSSLTFLFMILTPLISNLLGSQFLEILPVPKPDNVPTNQFSEGRSRKHVWELAEVIGVRELGTKACDIDSTNYILKQIHRLDGISDLNNWILDVDIQRPNGGITYNFIHIDFTNIYSNLTNIIVSITPKHILFNKEFPSLLLSAHYDSAVNARGAGDDASAVAVLLETLSVHVHTSSSLYNNRIIFLFNNAEETYLQGSHAFATQHPLAQESRLFINIEGIASGGGGMLFQNGPMSRWIVDIYKQSTDHPFSLVVPRDLFRFGVIPADTDYRILTQYPLFKEGKAIYRSGLDFVFFKNGFIYHSIHDDYKHISQGQLQHLGDTIVNISRNIVNSPLFPAGNGQSDDNSVHFDLFGYYLFIFNEHSFYCFFYLLLLLSLIHLKFNPIPYLFSGIFSVYIAVLTGLIAGLATAAINVYIRKQFLFWYSSILSGMFVYGPIIIISSFYMYKLLDKRDITETIYQSFYRHIHYQLYASVLIAFTLSIFQLVSAYICIFFILPPAICIAYIYIMKYIFIVYIKRSPVNIYICFIISVVIPAVYCGYSGTQMLQIAIPFAGRSGPLPAIFVEALIVSVLFVSCLSYTIPLYPYLSSFHISPSYIYIYILISLLILTFSPPPFTAKHPRRAYIMYTSEYSTIHLYNRGDLYYNRYRNSPFIENRDREGYRTENTITECDPNGNCIIQTDMNHVLNLSKEYSKNNNTLYQKEETNVLNNNKHIYTATNYIYISPTDAFDIQSLFTKLEIPPKTQFYPLSPRDWLSHLPVSIFYRGNKYKTHTNNPVFSMNHPYLEITSDMHCIQLECFQDETRWYRNITLKIETIINGVTLVSIHGPKIVNHNTSYIYDASSVNSIPYGFTKSSPLKQASIEGQSSYLFRHSGGYTIHSFSMNFLFDSNKDIYIDIYTNYNQNNLKDNQIVFETEIGRFAKHEFDDLLIYPFYGYTQHYIIDQL